MLEPVYETSNNKQKKGALFDGGSEDVDEDF